VLGGKVTVSMPITDASRRGGTGGAKGATISARRVPRRGTVIAGQAGSP
jgi:hypothetical protein